MGVCRRAARYLARKKGKAALLFLIFFFISALLLICFSVLDGTGQAARDLRSNIGAAFTIRPYAFDSQDLTKGQKVTVNANWTPTSANVQIGLIDNNTGYGLVKTVSNGSGSASFEITGDANFSIFIGNLSTSSIHFDVSYIVN